MINRWIKNRKFFWKKLIRLFKKCNKAHYIWIKLMIFKKSIYKNKYNNKNKYYKILKL